MAHMIDETTGTAAIAYAGTTPWHGLGRKLTQEQRTSLAAAMEAAGCGFDVDRIELRYVRPGTAPDQSRQVPDAFGIVRLDTGAYLATVGNQFHPVQHRDAFQVVESLVSQHGCIIEVMGSLDAGRRAFCLLRMPDATITVAGDTIAEDDVRGYILVSNAHDGSMAVRAQLVQIRVVCQNTFDAAQAAGTSTAVAIRHTKTAQDRMAQAEKTMQQLYKALQSTGETFRQMAEKRMSPKAIAEYIEQVIPATADPQTGEISATLKARREEIARLVWDGAGQARAAGFTVEQGATAWHAFNAVTEYFDHNRVREAKSLSAQRKAQDSAIFGGNMLVKSRALALAAA